MPGILSLMASGSVAPVNITNTSASDTSISPSHASCSYQLNTDGTAKKTVTGVLTNITGQWLVTGASSLYTARAHVNSGTSPSGSALDSDLALSSTRTWTLTTVGVSSLTCDLLITIKLSGTTIATAVITLNAVES